MDFHTPGAGSRRSVPARHRVEDRSLSGLRQTYDSEFHLDLVWGVGYTLTRKPKWRNRQTRTTQNRVPSGLWVRFPPSALYNSLHLLTADTRPKAVTLLQSAGGSGSLLERENARGSLALCSYGFEACVALAEFARSMRVAPQEVRYGSHNQRYSVRYPGR